ncbi:MAG: lysine biosynthesis protein LysX [Candidatus Nezhaarchaeales archaeon]
MKILLLQDRVRWEEKQIMAAAQSRGVNLKPLDAKDVVVDFDFLREVKADIALQRCVSHFRGLYLTAALEAANLRVVNSFATMHVCGDKLLSSIALFKAGVPSPSFAATFTVESALKALTRLNYPAVSKPVVGSHGRLLSLVKDRDAAIAILEHEEALGSALHRIHYFQEFIDKPSRDIRIVVVGGKAVAAIYRYAPQGEWRTNVAIGGTAKPCPLTNELEGLALKAAKAMNAEVAGVDIMEKGDELLVNEVNPTVEFRGASLATNVDIAGEIVDYLIREVKR